MKFLLLGRDGQVGWELQRSLAPLGEVLALGRLASSNPHGLCGDLTQLDALANTVRQVRPDVIVNAAAHTAVDKAEGEPELARCLNTFAPAVLADEAQRIGAWLVHYSTDYVFDGSGQTPWSESDPTGPLSVYGQTKLDGERAMARCERHLIFRTSWVYAARGGNFAKTMMRLARERELMQVIDDQFGAPTGAELLADVTAHALRQVCSGPRSDPVNGALAGVYHLTASGCTSWYEYAKYVLALMSASQPAIEMVVKQLSPVPTASFPTAARRPHNSRLDTTKLQKTFGLHLPMWQTGVLRMLNEIDYGRTR
jgi:dTDP-4-dehydrorhamnose reductase